MRDLEKWFFQNTEHSIGHIPEIADVDHDQKDEVCLGYAIIDDDGTVLWDADQFYLIFFNRIILLPLL